MQGFAHMDYAAFFGGYLGNYYLILCFPDLFRYELFEMGTDGASLKSGAVMTDFEDFNGRKNYAEETAGGYYACRLGVLEELLRRRRQASVLVLRFITSEYYAHLGVWVCREATRKAMHAKPLIFESKELLLEYAKKLAKKRFNYDIASLLKRSRLLPQVGRQQQLQLFLNV